jgi:hypothetical protein
MAIIETWGPVFDYADQLYREARETQRLASERSHDGSFGMLTRMRDDQLRTACLGAAMAKYWMETEEGGPGASVLSE